MRKLSLILILAALLLLFCSCENKPTAQIAATTLPVYEFAEFLCQSTDIRVTRIFDQNLSCLHDYTLQISQMQAMESAQLVIISGAGLEDSLKNMLPSGKHLLDASEGIQLLESGECHHHEENGHHHETDPHIWLDPENARIMARNIAKGLSERYPDYADTYDRNLALLEERLDDLNSYAQTHLASLPHRQLITFHDGFSYMAQAFDLEILRAVEEESGSEASASELIELIRLVKDRQLPAIFTEVNGSPAAAAIISAETDTPVYALNMAMSGDSYFTAMYSNIDTLKEALE